MIYRHFGNRVKGSVQSALLADFGARTSPRWPRCWRWSPGSASSAEEFRQSFAQVLRSGRS